MKHLHLENIGPISIVDIDLRRYNVFIGPQSSGKSTIAKLISLCSWVEKRAATTLSENIFANAEDFKIQAEPVETYAYRSTACAAVSYQEMEESIPKS